MVQLLHQRLQDILGVRVLLRTAIECHFCGFIKASCWGSACRRLSSDV